MTQVSDETINANIEANIRGALRDSRNQRLLRHSTSPRVDGHAAWEEPPNSNERVDTRRNEVNIEAKPIKRIDCNCTSMLALTVAFIHLSAALLVAANSSDEVAQSFAVAAIIINVLLGYGAIFCRKELFIGWLAFYAIGGFMLMSSISPRNVKVQPTKTNPVLQPPQPSELTLAAIILFVTAIMLGSVFVVCKSLDQLGDCQQDRTNLRAPSEQTEHSSSDQEPTTGNNQPSPPPAVLNQCWIESDRQNNRNGQRISNGVSQPRSNARPRVQVLREAEQYENFGGIIYPNNLTGTRSEQELATISAAIAAYELSSQEQQRAAAAATIYPDSTLPSYNQENGVGSQKMSIFGDCGSRKGFFSRFRTDKLLVLENSDEQSPPTYESALKMMADDLSSGSLPNAPIYWPENNTITDGES